MVYSTEIEEYITPVEHVVDGGRLLAWISIFIHDTTAAWHKQGDTAYKRSFPQWTKALPREYPLNVCYWIEKLNYHAYNLWHYRDYANTDRLMLQDNKFYPADHWAALNVEPHREAKIEAIYNIDSLLVREQTSGTAPYHSETLGGLLDRISVTQLKIYHTLEADTSQLAQLNRLFDEYSFLEIQAATLLNALRAGTVRLKLYTPLRIQGLIA